jgi:hypothetical protein
LFAPESFVFFVQILNDSVNGASDPPETAVQLNNIPVSRPLMHPVNVLRDDCNPAVLLRHVGNDKMSRMGLAREDGLPSQFVKLQYFLRIIVKRLLAGVFLPSVLVPDTPSSPVRGDSAFSGHSRAGEKNDALIIISPDCRHRASLPIHF